MRRSALALLALVTLLIAWFTPLTRLLPGPFSAHMTVHMAVVAVAAPLLAFAVAGSRWDPVRHVPWLLPPVPISIVELVVVWAWHAPALHHFARHSTLGLVCEQASFLTSGILVWLSAFGGDPHTRQDRTGAGILALLLTSMHMTFLGALLALPPRALYTHHAHHGAHDPLQDQHLGGAIMLLAGGIVYLLGGLWLTAELLRRLRAGASASPPNPEVERP